MHCATIANSTIRRSGGLSRDANQFGESLGRLATLAVLVGGCLFAGWETWPKLVNWHKQSVAIDVSSRIATTTDDRVELLVRQLVGLGPAAFPQLVAAAASERAAVAEVARNHLSLIFSELLVRSYKEVDEETAAEFVELARALAEGANKFGPAGKRWAERLALRMIDHADRFPPADATSLLSQCGRVLDAVPPQGPRQRTVAVDSRLARTTRLSEPLPEIDVRSLATPSEHSLAGSNQQPPFAKPLPPMGHSQANDDSTVLGNPLRVDSSDSTPPGQAQDKVRSGEAFLSVEVAPPTDSLEEKTISKLIDVPTPAEMRERAHKLRTLSTDTLLGELAQADRFTSGTIRQVLADRGLKDGELELAIRAKSPEVKDRLQAIEQLPSVSSAAARRLLRMLVTDESGEVRLRALTVLATTNDPGLQDLARRLVVQDKDPRVAEFASRLLRQQVSPK